MSLGIPHRDTEPRESDLWSCRHHRIDHWRLETLEIKEGRECMLEGGWEGGIKRGEREKEGGREREGKREGERGRRKEGERGSERDSQGLAPSSKSIILTPSKLRSFSSL